jgi:ABC-type branched-subunit amino acid transport system substrate-binding protein
MKHKASRKRFPILALALAAVALALLALACEEEEEEAATPTPTVTPTEEATPIEATPTPTPAALKPGAAGISSNPRDVRGLEGVLTLDDGLAIFKQRPASDDRTGVTSDSLKLCISSALTGPFASFFVPGLEQVTELVDRLNEIPGGIHGRQIELLTRDDQYRPDLAVDVWNDLVMSEGCFASFGPSGTPTLNSTIDFLRANKIPTIQSQTGTTQFCEPTDSLMFCTALPPYLTEGKAMGEYVLGQQPDAKVAIIYQDDDFGNALLAGARAGVPQAQIVAEIAYAFGTPDLTPHALQAEESGADYLLILAIVPTPQIVKTLRETVGSDMKVVAEYASITSVATKDTAGSQNFDGTAGFVAMRDPEATDTATVKYKALLEETGIGTGHLWQISVWQIEMLVRALEMAGPDLTREGLIEAMELGFDGSWKCSTCLSPTIYGPQDHWATETLQAVMWSHAQQKYLRPDDVTSHETSEGKGIRGNFPGYECSAELPCPWGEEG